MNTALLTGSSLIMSLISMSFQVWLAGRIGSAGIGLYQLVVSVSFLCTTFAISGVRFAATRLVSEEIGREREQGISGAMRRCFVYSALFGTAAFFVLHSGAEMIGFLWIGDARTVRSLRIMAYAMPDGVAVLGDVGLFHRLRQGMEADSCAFFRADNNHCARCIFPCALPDR